MSGLELTIGWPLALYGLLLVPLIALLALRSRYPLGRRRLVLVSLTRALSIALVVAAVSDLRLSWPTEELAVVTVIDQSASVSDADRTRIRRAIEELADAHDDVAWITPPQQKGVTPATDVSVGALLLPRDRVRRMIVATDGRDPNGHLGAAIAAAHRAGTQVSVLPMGDEPPIDLVSVTGLSVPRIARAGDRIDVGVELHASRDTEVHLALAVDGEVVASSEALARRGGSMAPVTVEMPDEEGVHEVSVTVRANGDVVAENNHWTSLVRIAPKPRVRILHDPKNGRPALARVLEEGGMRVDLSAITEAPSEAREFDPYALLIVDEADPNALSEAQQMAIRRWVEEEGGGLITITGGHPIRRTPRVLREIEPLTIPQAIPEPRPLELVLVIDRSSSMSGIKMMQARAAGVAAINALRSDARVGIVAFSSAADRVMAPVGMEAREDAIAFVQGIRASGGTEIGFGLQAANSIMTSDSRYIRHVIVLSDGVSAPDRAIAAAHALASRGVSITAITLGPRNALMEEIARIGRGRYHVTHDAGSLPSLFVREAQYRQPPANRRGAIRPRVSTPLAMLDGVPFDEAPALGGHVLATARPNATTVLAADRLPILAHWHRGLGQAATFTSATSGAWADEWRRWSGFRTFWVSLAEGMLRTRPIEPPELSLAPHPLVDGVRTLTVLAPTLDSERAPLVRIFREPGAGEPLELAERGPGIWQAEIIEEAGFLVDARMPGDDHPTVAVGFDRPYDPELARFGADQAELSRLAAAGGGALLSQPEAILDSIEAEPVMRSLRMPLFAAALTLYLLGLLLLRLPDPSVRAAVVRPVARERRAAGRGGAERDLDEAA